ncbi:DNA-protecting protein DprA [Candidatus Saganbacteria bacterium]|nr:DNA-protecting protein DprA [Candidatus Saganbacteria bacterium]
MNEFSLIGLDDDNFPKLLKEIHDPPKKLYLKGNLLPQDERSIAIVGTRKPSHYGLSIAKRFAYELSNLGITIVSGLAVGIDTTAHNGALEAKGRTIAVLGTGISVIYPYENKELYQKIIESGAVVSELQVDQKPANWTFPRRNRIISGLSLGTIVIEGGYKSGAMITAKLALDQGREVFAVPGNIESELSKGPHWLIKQGAKLVENIDDILDELSHIIGIERQKENDGPIIQIDHSQLSFEENLILKEVSKIPVQIDSIVHNSNLNTSQVLVLLSQLEIKGIIRQLPGKLFVVI